MSNEELARDIARWLEIQPDKDKMTGKVPYEPEELLTSEEVAKELGIEYKKAYFCELCEEYHLEEEGCNAGRVETD